MSTQTKRTRGVVLGLLAGLLSTGLPAAAQAPAAAPTTQKLSDRMLDLMREMNDVNTALEKALPAPGDLLNPARRTELAPTALPLVKRMLAIIEEMSQSNAHAKVQMVTMHQQYLVLAYLMGDADAETTLERASESKNPAEAFTAQTTLLQARWWRSDRNPALQAKILDDLQALAKANPEADLLAKMLFDMLQGGVGSRQIRERAEDILIKDLKSQLSAHLSERAQAAQKLRATTENKPLTLQGTTLDGKAFSSADLKGKVILVNFWASQHFSWIEHLPRLQKAYADHHAQGLEIVGLCCDKTADEAKAFLAKHPEMPGVHLFDPANPGLKPRMTQFGIIGLPAMFLIDRAGNVRSVSAQDDLESLIPKLLAEKGQ